MLEKFLLQWMQRAAPGKPLDRADLVALRFDSQHQAGADQLSVERDAAGAAIARGATFLGAGQSQRSAQRVEHGVIRLAQESQRLAVDGGGYVLVSHRLNVLPRAWRRLRQRA